MKMIYIYPFCSTGKEVLDCLDGQTICKGFITDDKNWIGEKYNGISIFSSDKLNEINEEKLILVHGSSQSYLNRKEISDRFNKYQKTTIIHPSANISKYAKIGNNVVIMANVVVTADAIIEDDVLILPNSTIHHDSIIGRYTIVGGNVLVAGNVKIGINCYIGAGSNFKNGIKIANKTLVGMGSNVVKSINDEKTTIKGNPAK